MSLVELMVALVIGMVMSLAIFGVLAASQGRQRTTTASSDLAQAGSFAMITLDKWLRSAGSGLAQAGAHAYGCDLYAGTTDAPNGAATRTLPRATALPLPFTPMDTTPPTGTAGLFRLAPVIIVPGGSVATVSGESSDALIVMSGASGFGETSVPFAPSGISSASSLPLVNTLSFRGDDLILITEVQPAAAASSRCLLDQVQKGFVAGSNNVLPLAGKFHADALESIDPARADPVEVAEFTGNGGRVSNVGNAAEGTVRNVPTFLLIGVGTRNTLFSYDLANLSSFESSTASVPVADSVFELHARYGIDSNGDGSVDAWVAPDSASHSPQALLAGTAAARERLMRIRAVRVGLIMRSMLKEKEAVAPPSLVLFGDLGEGLAYTRSALTQAQQHFRYRTVESTIPLRNAMLGP